MSKDKKKSSDKQSNQENKLRKEPWISMRSGIIIIAITSIAMTVLTAIQAIPALGWVEGLFWSVLFGALIWIIFFGMNFINRFLRR
ncbi:MAG: hypothetical protein JW730_14205 [Anaerolineales bacterium]|nr:hypothetical protein [Anaerolineales bacterium]